MKPTIPPDADQPITAQELYDFLAEFKPESHICIFINGKLRPIVDMSNDNGTLTLFTTKKFT